VVFNEKIKGKVEFGNQVPRDNIMYPKIDKEDLIAMQKRLGVKKFNFSDYIPNSMKPKRPGSRTSLASTIVGTTSCLTKVMSGLPGGAIMGPNGLIHNYNPNCQFSQLNEIPSLMNLKSATGYSHKTRNESMRGMDY
jgi:hypothetical protein